MKYSIAVGAFMAASLAFGQNIASSDKKFVDNAARGGMFEVQMGQIAANKAQNPEVVSFAHRMVTDHSNVNEELKRLASAKGITLPTEVSPQQKAEMDRLSGLSGPAFDRAYMRAMVTDHEKDLREFEREARTGKDPDIRKFAADTVPILRTHLQEARKVSASLHPPATGMF